MFANAIHIFAVDLGVLLWKIMIMASYAGMNLIKI